MTRSFCAPAATWAAEQFGHLDFGDGRLSKESSKSPA
jgi:hypothetical protein